MLVLGRRKNESIVIGQRIVVTVVEVKGKTVRVGIDAPRELPVHREEVARRLAQSSVPERAKELD